MGVPPLHIASIGKGGQLSLTNKGKTVLTLKTGKYKVVVTDQSTKGGFTLEPVDGKPSPVAQATYAQVLVSVHCDPSFQLREQ